jgi:hypothetical protein
MQLHTETAIARNIDGHASLHIYYAPGRKVPSYAQRIKPGWNGWARAGCRGSTLSA